VQLREIRGKSEGHHIGYGHTVLMLFPYVF